MSSSSFGKHATGATTSQSAVPEPSFAERARTLVHSGRIGSLSTLSRKQSGFPFGSLMPYSLDDQGSPIFLISTMAMHTQNLQADPRASLFVTEPDASGDPLGASRVTLIGSVVRIPEPELVAARTVYLTRYADSKYWVDFDDFFFYRMDVLDVYYVGGFGVMGWVAASEYSQAQSDPLVEHKSDIMQHMNADHKDALILLAKRFAGIEAQEAEMTSIDRLGLPSRLEVKLPPDFQLQVEAAKTIYHRFGQYSRALDQIRLLLEHRAVERAELQRMCSELRIPGDFDVAQISWRPDYDPFFYRQLSRRARRIYLFRDEYIFDVEKAVVVETPQLGHATYVFAKPRIMDTFLALYTKVTKDDIRRNRNNAAERLGFLGRVIHGTNPRVWLKELRQRVGEGLDFAAAAAALAE